MASSLRRLAVRPVPAAVQSPQARARGTFGPVALAGGTTVALQPGVAAAGDYGQHVRQCAQEHGFDGSHNPGMHRGASGWHHEEC